MPETAYAPDPKGYFTPSRNFSDVVISGHFASTTPNITPSGDAVIAYDLDAGNTVWYWVSGAWVSV